MEVNLCHCLNSFVRDCSLNAKCEVVVFTQSSRQWLFCDISSPCHFYIFICLNKYKWRHTKNWERGKVCYEPRRPNRPALVHRRVTPSIRFAGTHLYTWVERGTVRVKCLVQETNTMSLARTRTWTTRPRVKHTDHEATAPPIKNWENIPLKRVNWIECNVKC